MSYSILDEECRHDGETLSSPRRFPAWGLAVVLKWLQLGNARNMLMTVNIKLSIIVIAEIIQSTDVTCLHVYFKAFLLKMDRAK